MLRGRAAILAKAEMLEELCRRTGKEHAMRWLEYEMDKPTARKKIPTLLLIGLNEDVTPEQATAGDVLGAVMLYEYKFAGLGLQLFATDDMTGAATVIAPAHCRSEVTQTACGQLMDVGALAVLITFTPDEQQESTSYGSSAAFSMARQVRSVPLGLALGQTLDETLATLGKHTRRNLRAYRRRLELELGSEFVPQVEMERSDFLAFNRASMNPTTDHVVRWRYDSAHAGEEMMFAGIRARDGQWLSLMGGRRHGDTVSIDWQMNRDGMADRSLSTVLRCYVLEHETALGMKQMIFTGGTPHSMRHSFTRVDAVDAIAVRRSAGGRLVRWLAQWVMPGNFMVQLLRDTKLRWG
ncbi:MAG TPA: hypothetical protein VGU46_10115 [Acidobacteriaceae bacterium]|nr:hypothetical protein [Acidobacteriaceae bacterium]